MGTERPISTKVDDDLRERIRQYQDRRGLETQSAALRELLNTGLEESSPILSRLKDRVIESAFYLIMVAVVVAVSSVTTTLLTVPTGVRVATVLVAVSVGGIATVELARIARVQGRQLEGFR